MPPADSPSPTGNLDGDDLLDLFEKNWRSGTSPTIEEFLRRAGLAANDPARRKLLEALVTIDLEYQWRRPDGRLRPRMEDYTARHPELGRLEQLSGELIGAEYRVRQRWGDRPSHAEYAARFPRQGQALLQLLARIDAELARERPAMPAAVSKAEAPATSVANVAGLLATLRQCRLLDETQLAELARGRFAEPRVLAKELLRRSWLTPYQVNQLLQGRGADLVLGPYLLLERLGEGGAGQVFKARHQKMDRVVALKLIRKELLTDSEVLGRFHREIEVVSRLDHANVVHAYDAGPIPSPPGEGGARGHFLAMEYVEGTDLAKLVKQGGPLPVLQACAYIRQAALGLQHAHEKGLVHRDIKPHNLILSMREGAIKVADLGLARLQRAVNQEATAALTGGQATGSLTPVGAVMMGTADYLAPEQALDFHQADIRADIYGLGCTFYFLLTGRPPFAGGNLAEKVARHMHAEPPAIEQARPDLLPGLGAVLRKMLAKRPEERYQAPAEVAAALAAVIGGAPRPRSWARRAALLAAAACLVASLVVWMAMRRAPAAQELAKVKSRFLDNSYHPDKLRQDILDLRMRFPGTPEALTALALLLERPWPLDHLPIEPRQKAAVIVKPGQYGVSCVAFSPDDRLLALGGTDRKIHLYDTQEEKEVPALEASSQGYCGLAFAPDGRSLASLELDGTVRLWDLADRKPPAVLGKGPTGIVGLAFAPDGKSIVAWSTLEGQVALFDVATKQLRRSLAKHDRIVSVAFSVDGQTLAVAVHKGPARFWNVFSGAEQPAPFHPNVDIHALAYDAHGNLVVFRLNAPVFLEYWEPATGRRRTIIQQYAQVVRPFQTLDCQTVVAYSGEDIYRHDLTANQGTDKWAGGMGATHNYCAALANDGRHLVVGTEKGAWIVRLAPVPK